jgi:hypothetical protein
VAKRYAMQHAGTSDLLFRSRDGGIRTRDPLTPRQMGPFRPVWPIPFGQVRVTPDFRPVWPIPACMAHCVRRLLDAGGPLACPNTVQRP